MMLEDNQPTTKNDFKKIETGLTKTNQEIGTIKQELDKIKQELNDNKQELRQGMSSMQEEIIRHFYVVSEDLFERLSGANNDQISLHSDTLKNHEGRITHLEKPRLQTI